MQEHLQFGRLGGRRSSRGGGGGGGGQEELLMGGAPLHQTRHTLSQPCLRSQPPLTSQPCLRSSERPIRWLQKSASRALNWLLLNPFFLFRRHHSGSSDSLRWQSATWHPTAAHHPKVKCLFRAHYCNARTRCSTKTSFLRRNQSNPYSF